MKRIPEAELMEGTEQAKAYAEADFDVRHSKIIHLLDKAFNGTEIIGNILDLGCGSGDITFRLAKHYPKATIIGVDGSAAMLAIALADRDKDENLSNRIHFIQDMIPSNKLPQKKYDLIISTNFLHHLHRPDVLWKTLFEYATNGTKVFISDLFRPESKHIARDMVNTLAKDEPNILQTDFYNSLLAAFTPEEVEIQLREAGLDEFSVMVDDYMVIFGSM